MMGVRKKGGGVLVQSPDLAFTQRTSPNQHSNPRGRYVRSGWIHPAGYLLKTETTLQPLAQANVCVHTVMTFERPLSKLQERERKKKKERERERERERGGGGRPVYQRLSSAQ